MNVFLVIAFSCLGLASAILDPQASNVGDVQKQNRNIVLDYVHDYRFEQHNKKNFSLLIAISDVKGNKRCHVIEIEPKLKKALKDHDYMQKVTEEIYNLIVDGKADQKWLNRSRLFTDYHDNKLVNDCKKHRVFQMEYKPGFAMNPNMMIDMTTKRPHNHNHHHSTQKHNNHHHHSTHKHHRHTTQKPQGQEKRDNHHKHNHNHHNHHHHRSTTPTME